MGIRLDQFRLATNAEFGGIVTAALMKAREFLLLEDPETPNHANRIVFCNTVFNELGTVDRPLTTRFVWICAMNPVIQAAAVVGGVVIPENVADNDVDYIVASNINNVVGTA